MPLYLGTAINLRRFSSKFSLVLVSLNHQYSHESTIYGKTLRVYAERSSTSGNRICTRRRETGYPHEVNVVKKIMESKDVVTHSPSNTDGAIRQSNDPRVRCWHRALRTNDNWRRNTEADIKKLTLITTTTKRRNSWVGYLLHQSPLW